jgi:hypothetical protein
MVKWMMCVIVLAMPLAACSGEREDMKSPCVGNEDSPCGPRRAVNDWWLA